MPPTNLLAAAESDGHSQNRFRLPGGTLGCRSIVVLQFEVLPGRQDLLRGRGSFNNCATLIGWQHVVQRAIDSATALAGLVSCFRTVAEGSFARGAPLLTQRARTGVAAQLQR
jgi:hypothetical protein